MSPTRSGYKELGIDLVEPLRDQPRKPRRPPMGEEKKYEGAGDPIKMLLEGILLEEALEKQRNVMMDNFAQILQRIPIGGASTSRSNYGGATPFKVQVNFDIPIFDGQIDADVVDIWLNLLEGYFLVHEFSDREKIIFSHSSKPPPMSRTGGKPTRSKRARENPLCSRSYPLGILSEMPSRNNIIPWGAMRKNTYNGLLCGSKGTKMCMRLRICFIPYAQSWVSKIQRNIWC
jgi:hypothetical protein